MVKGEGERGGKASKCGNEKQGGKRGLTITEEKGRMAEEKREGLRTGVGGGWRTRRRLSRGDKRVLPERREIKGCPLKGFAPAGWGTTGRRRRRPGGAGRRVRG